MISTLLMQAAAPPPSAAPPSAAPPSAAPPATSTSTQAPGSPTGSGSPMGQMCGANANNPLVIFLPMIAIFYFLLIRPQQKKQKETESWLKSLKKGDEVVTSGGVIGRISGLADNTVTLEVQEKVRIKVLRSSISGKAPGAAAAASTTEPEKK